MCEKPNWICHAVISVWHRGVTVRSLPALSREGKPPLGRCLVLVLLGDLSLRSAGSSSLPCLRGGELLFHFSDDVFACARVLG